MIEEMRAETERMFAGMLSDYAEMRSAVKKGMLRNIAGGVIDWTTAAAMLLIARDSTLVALCAGVLIGIGSMCFVLALAARKTLQQIDDSVEKVLSRRHVDRFMLA